MIKVLAIIEAATVTGPAKNLLAFCQKARQHPFAHLPFVETSLATFIRNTASQPANEFVSKANELKIEMDVIGERFRFDWRLIDELRKLASRQSPDVIQTHNVKAHFLMRMSGLWRTHKWIAFHHGYTTTDAKMRLYNRLDRWSLKAAHRVVTMNKGFARQIESFGVRNENLRVIHNAVDVQSFSQTNFETTIALQKRLGIAEGERVVLAVGRLSEEKGHLDLIKAFARLSQQSSLPPVKLVVVGTGPEQSRLEQEIAHSGLAEKVIFAGQVANIKPYYAIADLLVLPSHSEGSPNVLLEAMAARVPVVATFVGGVPEIATNNQTALLIEAGNETVMAEAMMKMLNDSSLASRLAENGRSLVAKYYSPEIRLRSLLDIYQEITADQAVTEFQFA